MSNETNEIEVYSDISEMHGDISELHGDISEIRGDLGIIFSSVIPDDSLLDGKL